MRLDSMERLVRRAGGIGALIAVIAVYSGLLGGLRRAKGRVTAEAPEVARAFARGSLAVYLPASVAGAGLLYLLWRPVRLGLSAHQRAAALISGALLYFTGLALAIWGRLALGKMYNVSSSMAAQLYADHRLITVGPYRWIRHPMYVGGILAEVGAFLLYRTWAALIVLSSIPGLFLRARREDEVLAEEFGEEWAEYREQVPAWIPRLAKTSRKARM